MLNQYSLINIVGTQIFDCLTVNTTINELNYDDDEEPLPEELVGKVEKGKNIKLSDGSPTVVSKKRRSGSSME